MRVQFTRARSMAIATGHGPSRREFAIGDTIDIPDEAALGFIAQGDAIALRDPEAPTSSSEAAEVALASTEPTQEDSHAAPEKPRRRGVLGKRRAD